MILILKELPFPGNKFLKPRGLNFTHVTYMTRPVTNWCVFVFWHWRVALIHAFKRVQNLGMHRTGMRKKKNNLKSFSVCLRDNYIANITVTNPKKCTL